jgi:Uma2 family endonuclease
MAALAERSLSSSEFLDWTRANPGRFELERGRIVELSAERAKHALMKHAATRALEDGVAAAGLDCTVFPDGMLVEVDDAHVRLPDASVQCSPVDPESITLDQPVVLVEVASPSSVRRDEDYKLAEYFSVASVMHYLLLSPDREIVIHFRRLDSGGRIETRILSEGVLDLTPPGFSVTVAALLGRRGEHAA